MGIISIGFLILGIFFIIMTSLGLHKDKRKHPERESDYVSVFVMYLVGILYILGAVTGYIGIIIFLTTIMLLIFTRSYFKKKYSYSDSDIKEKIPKKYEKTFNVTVKHNKIMNINWKIIIIGIVLAVILNLALSMVAGDLGGLIAFLLATIYIGYTVGGDYKNGAVHGGIICAIITLILGILTVISIGDLVVVIMLVIWVITNSIIGAIGGIIGSLIKGSRSSKENSA